MGAENSLFRLVNETAFKIYYSRNLIKFINVKIENCFFFILRNKFKRYNLSFISILTNFCKQ